ncbi:MAG TPA: four helix bundle protein [Bacteroidia bacterium]|jgi:four helix bundle protein
MATIKKFEDITAWQQARVLSKSIYAISSEKPFWSDFELKGQIRSASGSIMDNIAEGFERGGRNEFIQFLAIAKASAAEVRSQLYRALDQKYISEECFEELYKISDDIGKMISALIGYLIRPKLKVKNLKTELATNTKLKTRNYYGFFLS